MEEKTRHEISEDELVYRQMLYNQWKVEPSRKAVEILQSRIAEVLKKLGIDTDADDDSIHMQMELLGCTLIRCLDMPQLPDCTYRVYYGHLPYAGYQRPVTKLRIPSRRHWEEGGGGATG